MVAGEGKAAGSVGMTRSLSHGSMVTVCHGSQLRTSDICHVMGGCVTRRPRGVKRRPQAPCFLQPITHIRKTPFAPSRSRVRPFPSSPHPPGGCSKKVLNSNRFSVKVPSHYNTSVYLSAPQRNRSQQPCLQNPRRRRPLTIASFFKEIA